MTKTISQIGNSQGIIFDAALIDVAASKVDHDATTRRLRKLVKPFRKR